MFVKSFNEYLDNCLNDLMNSENEKIKTAIQNMKVLDPETFEMRIKGLIVTFSSEMYHKEMTEGQAEEAFGMILEDMAAFSETMKQVMVISVKARGLENELNRTLILPMTMTIADLGYYILASMNACGDRSFTFIHQDDKYQCVMPDDDPDEDVLPAQSIPVALMNLKKWDRLSMIYGDDDPYEFDISVKNIKKINHISSYDDAKITDGCGYGIWDDGRTIHEIYLMGTKKELKARLKEEALDLDFFPYDEIFDLKSANETFEADMFQIKIIYEAADEFDMNDIDYDELGDMLMDSDPTLFS